MLKVPKFEVKPGEVVAIVGRVGSGKSSVFQAILQNMVLKKGHMSVGGSVSYVPQTPWVQNLPLKDNILFGLPFDEVKYQQVIHACALELDLQILPNGDQSMAGERGINLSGGQRQRVGLARATYHDAELVLLDNPLSAVDQHTAIHIFQHCIRGMLRDKAVIWITHQLELLPQCDKIAVVEDGNMTYFGPYNADVLNQRLPVDHLLFATVEAGDAAVKRSEPETPVEGSNHGPKHNIPAGHGPAAPSSSLGRTSEDSTSKDHTHAHPHPHPIKRHNRKSYQRSSMAGEWWTWPGQGTPVALRVVCCIALHPACLCCLRGEHQTPRTAGMTQFARATWYSISQLEPHFDMLCTIMYGAVFDLHQRMS